MIKNLDLTHIFIPIGLFALALILFFRGQPQLQLQILVASSIFYVGLSLLHHHQDKSLTLEVAIEYILIAALIIIILQGQLL